MCRPCRLALAEWAELASMRVSWIGSKSYCRASMWRALDSGALLNSFASPSDFKVILRCFLASYGYVCGRGWYPWQAMVEMENTYIE